MKRGRAFVAIAALATLAGAGAAVAQEPAAGRDSAAARRPTAGRGPGAPVRSAPPLRLGLEEAVRRAVTLNDEVLIARAEEARVRGLETEVRSRSLPELTADFGYTRNIQRPVIFFNAEEGVQQVSIGNDNEYAFGLTLRQPLIDFSLGPARRAAGLSRRSTAATVEAARTSVALAARVDYYTVLLDEALLDVQERALAQARDRLAEVEQRHRAGTASDFDLLTAQVEVDNIRPELIEARNRLEQDRDGLKRTLALPLDRELVLTDSLRPMPEGVPEAPVEQALAERADVDAQRIRVDLQQANLDAEEGGAWPSFDLVANFSRRASSDEFLPAERDYTQSASAGISMSLPIFDGRARSGRVQQAEAARDRERYRLERLEADVRLEVQQAERALAAARERVAASEANVTRAERALEIAQTRFQNGLSTQVELNDAELAATRARTNHARALYDVHVARARLMAAIGER